MLSHRTQQALSQIGDGRLDPAFSDWSRSKKTQQALAFMYLYSIYIYICGP